MVDCWLSGRVCSVQGCRGACMRSHKPDSVPEDEDSLAAEGVFGLDDALGEVLAVVADLGPHVVDEEGLREVEFIVRVRHRLEVQGHGRAALDIADLEAASRRVAVSVEESGNLLAVLREERVVKTLLPLLVEVHDVISLRGEESAQFLVGEELVEDIDLIDGGLAALVSDAGGCDQSGGQEVQLPEGSVGHHHEGEASVGNEGSRPHVVGAVEARADLIEIVASAHAPFPVVSVDQVGHIAELGRVSLGLGSLGTIRSMVGSSGADVVAVGALRWLEAHVVVARLVVLAETELGGRGQEGTASLGSTDRGLQHF
mmetsp:Transcript_18193/g.21422  ORF Transcript_18193/g.21422 Transcript_18193/m.21422 type:complete len:315 (-) Transcript_18193:21-965(-)